MSTRKSVAVSAGLVTALSASLLGCADSNDHQEQAKPQCVREENGQIIVVEENLCPTVDQDHDDDDSHMPIFWYYGGSGGHSPGSVASGGNWNKTKVSGPSTSGSSSSKSKSGHIGGSSSGKSSSGAGE